MKISSVSKKVLASALSAAMVVAFAPTVAFAKPAASTPQGTMVTVTYEANGGNVTTGKTLAGDYASVVADNATGHKWVQLSVAGSNAALVSKGAAATGWFVDTDGDGVKGTTETAVELTGGEYWLDLTEAGVADASAVTLKAIYAESAIGTVAFTANDGSSLVYDSDADGTADMTAAVITIPVTATNAIAGHTYKLTVTNPDGTVVGEKTWKPDPTTDAATIATGNQVIYFAANPNSADKMAAYESMLVSGEYKVVLTDNDAAISTAKIALAKVTYLKANGTEDSTEIVELGANGTLSYNLKAGTWTNAKGDVVSSEVISGPVTYTAASADASKVAAALTLGAYTPGAGVDVPGKFQYQVAAVAGAGTKDTYVVTLTDPAGNTIYTASGVNASPVDVSFNPTAAGARTTASEQAGTYALTLAYTKDGVTTTAKKSFTLTQVKYDAGEFGSYAKNTQVSYFDTTPTAIAYANRTTASAAVPGAPTIKDGYTFKEWQLNGAAITTKTALKIGEVNTYTATYKAVDYAAAPGWTIEKTTVGTTDYYTLSVAAAAGTKAWTSKDADAVSPTYALYGAPIVMTKAQFNAVAMFGVKSVSDATVSKPADKVIKLVNTARSGATAADAWKALTSGGANKLETQVGVTGVKWLAVNGVASAIASGKAAADGMVAKYLVEETEYNKTMAASEKAVYEAVAAEADAQVAAYDGEALVVAGTKAYKMSAAAYKTAAATYSADKKTAEAALAASNKTAADYQTALNAYITAAGNFLTVANGAGNVQDIKVADIQAAQTVTSALKAADTAEAAEKALADYAALSDDAKKLVATADVTKAEAIVAEAKAAAELKVAQDDAAVSKARNTSKTVKAGKNGKTTKKQSVTLKSITSKSGAKVTYKKSSGSSKVSVKSGKAYLAKGVKKGTYKATVKATCGTQTAKITVKFVVK